VIVSSEPRFKVPGRGDPGRRVMSFLDDEHVALVQNVTRVLAVPDRADAPVLVRDRAWEDMLFLNGAWSLRPSPGGDGLVAWYENWRFDVRRANDMTAQFLESGGRARFTSPEFSLMDTLVATSADGRHWSKPERDTPKGTFARTNVILGDDRLGNAHAFTAIADPAVGYRGLFVNEPRHGGGAAVIRSATSADGIDWRLDAHDPAFGTCGSHLGDVMSLSRDEAGDYVLFTRHPRQVTPRTAFPAARVERSFFPPYLRDEGFAANKRRIWLCRSADFSQWSDPVEVLVPRAGVDNVDESFYNLAHVHNGDLHVGFLTVLHEVANTTEVRLVTSRDLVNWRPVAGATPFLAPRGTGWEAGTVNVCSTPIATGDEWWIYYGATPYHHDWWWVGEREGLDTPESRLERGEYALGLARVGAGRLVGLAAGLRTGLVLTQPVPAGRSRIRIDVVAGTTGRVRVAIVDGSGAAHPGLGLDDLRDLPADARRATVMWDGSDTVDVPPGSRVLVELQDATLYGIAFEPAEETSR
jgi:hypothetical protein